MNNIKKNLKVIAIRIQQHNKRNIYPDHVGFIPGNTRMCQICKSINAIHHFNRIKDKTHILISDAEKVFHKVQHLFMMKKLSTKYV